MWALYMKLEKLMLWELAFGFSLLCYTEHEIDMGNLRKLINKWTLTLKWYAISATLPDKFKWESSEGQ